MSTETILRPPTVDERTEQEETKYTLYRPAGATGILPSPGTGWRRFSKAYVNKAKGIDSTLDAYPAPDQGPWQDHDIRDEETWSGWCRS